MKKRLTRISPLQLGVVLAILHGLFSLIFIVPMSFFYVGFMMIRVSPAASGTSASPALMGGIVSILLIVLLPLLYAAMGFILGVLSGAVYNLVAKWTGGIDLTVADAPEP